MAGKLESQPAKPCPLDMGISEAKEFFQWARQEFNQSDYGARKLGIRHSYAPALFNLGLACFSLWPLAYH